MKQNCAAVIQQQRMPSLGYKNEEKIKLDWGSKVTKQAIGTFHYIWLNIVLCNFGSRKSVTLKMGHFRPLFFFIFFFSIQLTVNAHYKVCWWLDLNHGPLDSEETALPTEPQPLPRKSVTLRTLFHLQKKLLVNRVESKK